MFEVISNNTAAAKTFLELQATTDVVNNGKAENNLEDLTYLGFRGQSRSIGILLVATWL